MSPRETGIVLVAGPDDAGRRLDKVLRAVLRDKSLSEIYAALRKGRIRVNDRKAEPSQKLEAGDRIYLHDSLGPRSEVAPAGVHADELASLADILILATADLLFVNKRRGELSQGAEGLEGRVRRALAARTAASLSFAPGPLHRLDRNTTGIMAFPRSSAGARAFTALLRERRVAKRYLALVDGEEMPAGTWRDRIARDEATLKSSVSAEGDEARAEMRPLLRRGGLGLLLIELHSGLTHQIRVQASSRGIPLAGDAKYGGGSIPGGYILHALSLGFPSPPFPDLPGLVAAPLPAEASSRLESIFGAEELREALSGFFS